MSSILTNNGAMVALQTLKNINNSLAKTQDEVSTGKSVATAKDNAAVWAIAKTMESDVAGLDAIAASLSVGESTVAVARGATESISDLLKEMKKTIVSAQDATQDKDKLQGQLDQLASQINGVINSAQFNGLNLVNGSETATVEFLSSLDRDNTGAVTAATIDIDPTTTDLTAVHTAVEAYDLTDPAAAATALDDIETQLQTVLDAAATFGSVGSRMEIQSNFLGKLSDALTSGVGSLVDADMEEVSARLQALQVQQQLGTQSLAIANQAPQTLLKLFG